MPKSLSSAVTAQISAQQKRPCLLYELGLSSTLRFAAAKTNVVFPTGGNVYTAKAITLNTVSQSLEGQIGRVTVKFDNVSRDMAAYANAQDVAGVSLLVMRVYLDALGAASDYNEIFRGTIERPVRIGREWMTLTATTGTPLNRKTSNFFYQRMCPWRAGGAECNTNGNFNLGALTASGTADSGSTTTLVDNALTQADDYWNYGSIIITKAGVDYMRTVKDFAAATDTITLDVALPVPVDGTCTYVVYKGCDGTWDTCGGANAWGPSANNQLNFGGCLHISKERDAS